MPRSHTLRRPFWLALTVALATLGAGLTSASAQSGGGLSDEGASGGAFSLDSLQGFGGNFGAGSLGGGGLGDAFGASPQPTFSASYTLAPASRRGTLTVEATIPDEFHIFSLTQPPGGPQRSTLRLAPGQAATIDTAGADATPSPTSHVVPEFPVPMEEHRGRVVWRMPVRLTEPTGTPTLDLVFNGQICGDDETNAGCIPVRNVAVEAAFAGIDDRAVMTAAGDDKGAVTPPARDPSDAGGPPTADGSTTPKPVVIAAMTEAAAAATPYATAGSIHAKLGGYFTKSKVAVGETVDLVVTAVPEAGFHIYAVEPFDPKGVYKPTLFAADSSHLRVERIEASKPVVEKPLEGVPDEAIRYYDGPVTWRVTLRVLDADAEPALPVGLGLQTCSDEGCDPPAAVRLTATTPVAVTEGTTEPPAVSATIHPFKYGDVAKLADIQAGRAKPGDAAGATGTLSRQDVGTGDNDPTAGSVSVAPGLMSVIFSWDFGHAILWALLGGLLLNLMPCVLPVIGLKVMSFVDQAGKSTLRAFELNASYALGILSVFATFATIVVVAKVIWEESFGWGQQASIPAFNITMATIVFAMALSFIGVWEIPIPGFVGSSSVTKVTSRSGLLAAMLKGIITTLIAIPCTGPGVATALQFTADKHPVVIYAVFLMIGFGMALPYLVLGAFTPLMKMLPRPGAWMDTFKHVMGFLLLGTVIWMMSVLPFEYLVPTVALLFATWFALWIVGRTQISPRRSRVWAGWTTAAVIILLASLYSFKPQVTTIPAGALLGFNADPVPIPGLLASEEERLVRVASRMSGTPTTVDGWEPFSVARLGEELDQGRVVMVDFTADWCLTCKVLERTVLNTRAVGDLVARHDVVKLQADFTDYPDDLRTILERLAGTQQLPVIAVFSPTEPNKPAVFIGAYTQTDITSALSKAASMRPAPVADVATARVSETTAGETATR